MRPADFAQIVAMAALWGASFLFLRVAAPEFGPVPLIFIRVAIAALFLCPVLLARPRLWQEFRANLRPLLLLGIINAAIPFPLFAYATLHVTAGFAAILNSTAPLFAALVAWLWLRDRLTSGAIVGLLLGVAGVVVLVGGVPASGAAPSLAIAGALFACLCYGTSASYVKRHLAGVNSWVTTAGSFGFAAILLLPLSLLHWPVAPPSATAWAAVVLLAIACTSLPNIYYFRLVLRVGPGRAMAVAFLIPGFGMLWGALALGEPITAGMITGCLVILLGTSLVTGVLASWLRAWRRPGDTP